MTTQLVVGEEDIEGRTTTFDRLSRRCSGNTRLYSHAACYNLDKNVRGPRISLGTGISYEPCRSDAKTIPTDYVR